MKSFKNKKVLITGGLGFIGSNLAIKLSGLGSQVEVYDSMISGFGGNLFNVKFVEKKIKITIADLRNTDILKQSIKGKDYIFNLAGNLSHVDSMLDPFMDLDINCRAQLCLLETCRKFNPEVKIIFAGTRNQYGKALYLPIDEKHLQEPTDINGINSIVAEKYHFLYFNVYGIEATSLRMTNTFGPRHQMMHPRQGVLNWFLRQIIDGETVNLYGDGSQIRDINYIDDVVNALILSAISPKSTGEPFNLGGSPLSLLDFVKLAIKVFGLGKYKIVIFPKERKEIEIGNYIADTKKIRNELGWSAKVSVEEGIGETLDYYKKYKKYYW